MDDLIRDRIRELAPGAEVPRAGRPGFFRTLFAAPGKTPETRETVLPAINALIELHGLAETDSPASLPVFREALPHALAQDTLVALPEFYSLLEALDETLRPDSICAASSFASPMLRYADETLPKNVSPWSFLYPLSVIDRDRRFPMTLIC